MHHVDFAREDVDLAVRHGDGNWPGLDVVRLCSEQLFAVCSPKLLAGRQRMRKPSDVLKFPLLHLDDRKDWSKWLEAAGVVDAELSHGPVLNRASMVIDAAVDGQGVALARTTLAAWDLINGRLVRPFAGRLCDCPRPTGSSARRRRRRSPRSRRSATGCWPRPPRMRAASRRCGLEPLGEQLLPPAPPRPPRHPQARDRILSRAAGRHDAARQAFGTVPETRR